MFQRKNRRVSFRQLQRLHRSPEETEMRREVLSAVTLVGVFLLLAVLWWVFYVEPHTEALLEATRCSSGENSAWLVCYQGAVREAGSLVRFFHEAPGLD